MYDVFLVCFPASGETDNVYYYKKKIEFTTATMDLYVPWNLYPYVNSAQTKSHDIICQTTTNFKTYIYPDSAIVVYPLSFLSTIMSLICFLCSPLLASKDHSQCQCESSVSNTVQQQQQVCLLLIM